MINIH